MRTILLLLVFTFCSAKLAAAAEEKPQKVPSDAKLLEQITQLVSRLNADRAADRDDAEKKLLELAGTSTAQSDRLLAALPRDNDQMPLALRDRLSRIRQQLED